MSDNSIFNRIINFRLNWSKEIEALNVYLRGPPMVNADLIQKSDVEMLIRAAMICNSEAYAKGIIEVKQLSKERLIELCQTKQGVGIYLWVLNVLKDVIPYYLRPTLREIDSEIRLSVGIEVNPLGVSALASAEVTADGGKISPDLLKRGMLKEAEANIASGTWTENWHLELNKMIEALIGTDNDVTNKYDQEELIKELKIVLANLISVIPERLREDIAKSLKAKDSSLTIDNLLSSLEKILENPKFKFFFLKPLYGDDVFRFMAEKDGEDVILTAQAHFGHNKTRGDRREENVYISSLHFDSLAKSEKLGLIIHEMIYLVLGKGEDTNKLAELFRVGVDYSYDKENFDLDEVKNLLRSYMVVKEDFSQAVIDEEREKAFDNYNKFKRLIDDISKYDVSTGTLSVLIFEEIAPKIGPVLVEIISNIGFAGGDINKRGILMDRLFSKSGIERMLANLVFDNIKELPLEEMRSDDYIGVIINMISMSLAEEVNIISHPQWPDFMRELVDEVLREVTEALYDDEPARKYWLDKLTQDILPYTVGNLIPEDYFKEGM
ncbi:MAG: hypothetical protein KAJ14_16070, partial [Candidatus Omnitrophica bacterium]|nr:hypothetical protein [Candidatus Omnitrophota bacterium]